MCKQNRFVRTAEIPSSCLNFVQILVSGTFYTAWKVSKYGGFSGPYFPVFSPSTTKYGPEKPPYLDTFHADLLKKTTLASFKQI